MKSIFMAMGLAACLLAAPCALWAQDPAEGNCHELVTLLKGQQSKVSADLRRIQREIAALRADFNKPGMADIFSGIGYILGIFGTAAFIAARRRKE